MNDNNAVINLDNFNMEKAVDDKDAMRRYSRGVRVADVLKTSISEWMHTHALKFNDPSLPELAAQNFKTWASEMVRYITSPEAGSDRLEDTKVTLDKSDAFAQAFKKFYEAMRYGGDLKADDMQTGSKCAAFVKKMKAKEDQEKKEAAIKDTIAALKSMGRAEEAATMERQLIAIQGGTVDTVPSPLDNPLVDPGEDEDIKKINILLKSLITDVYELNKVHGFNLINEILTRAQSSLRAQIDAAKSQAAAAAARLASGM